MLSTGTELRRPGEPLGPGEIYESNCADARGGARRQPEPRSRRLTPVADDADAHREALERGLAADVLVSSGGVSIGPHDLVRATAAGLGVEEVFWRVAVKPGKPVAFGVRGRTLVFGLPGNPVSALVGFELFVRPAVRALQGADDPGRSTAAGVSAARCAVTSIATSSSAPGAAMEDGEVVLEPVSGQESHMIVRAAAADALVLVPRGEGELEAGSRVRYLPL